MEYNAIESFNVYITAQLVRAIIRSVFKAKELNIGIEPGFIDVSLDHDDYIIRASIVFTRMGDETSEI